MCNIKETNMKVLLIILLLVAPLYAIPTVPDKIYILNETILRNKLGWVIGDTYTLCINNQKYLLITTLKGASVIQLFNYISTPTNLLKIPVKCVNKK